MPVLRYPRPPVDILPGVPHPLRDVAAVEVPGAGALVHVHVAAGEADVLGGHVAALQGEVRCEH